MEKAVSHNSKVLNCFKEVFLCEHCSLSNDTRARQNRNRNVSCAAFVNLKRINFVLYITKNFPSRILRQPTDRQTYGKLLLLQRTCQLNRYCEWTIFSRWKLERMSKLLISAVVSDRKRSILLWTCTAGFRRLFCDCFAKLLLYETFKSFNKHT